jgi:ABC-type multidrug transport system fused ATPase/permease subunit
LTTSIHERLELARPLRDVAARMLAPYVLLILTEALIPAATAVSTAWLISSAGSSGSSLLVPLLAMGGILMAGQVLALFAGVLRAAVAGQIDGAYRARLGALLAGGRTIEAIEGEEVQDLIRTASADPRDWIEKTPSDGALTQLTTLVRFVGMLFSAAVLASWSAWLLPPLLAAAVVVRLITARQWLVHYRIWAKGIGHSRRYLYWSEVATAPAEGKEIRVFGFADWLIGRHQHHMHLHLDPIWDDDRRSAKMLAIRFVITVLPLAAVYFLVARGVGDDGRSVAAAAAVFSAAWSIFTILGGTAEVIDSQGAKPVVRAARELEGRLATGRDEVVTSGPLETPPLVRFEQVSFRYAAGGPLVLDDLELVIKPGELLAIVGLNGAGKSTLTKLLAGLYTPSGGRITADSEDIGNLPHWQSSLAIVFQDFVKYPLSLQDNVALGRGSLIADGEQVRAAGRAAGLQDLVDRLPHGWDTMLDRSRTGGVDLSGGQWQQVVLARALYAVRTGAQVLVLDEPTAHLDVRAEFKLFRLLGAATPTLSTVLISHRLWTVRHADRIVLLDGGRVAEEGSHDELVAAGGRYADMFTVQAERFTRGYDDRIEESS